jgi:hypothetical protein
MANTRVTSTPLFGSPTGRQVKAVQDEIDAYTAKLIKNVSKARKVFEKAVPEPEPDEAPAQGS